MGQELRLLADGCQNRAEVLLLELRLCFKPCAWVFTFICKHFYAELSLV